MTRGTRVGAHAGGYNARRSMGGAASRQPVTSANQAVARRLT
jgi:hypothetical protein